MSLIQVNNITGSTPILVYIADINGNNQTYIDTISSPVPPPVFIVTIPPLFSTANQVMVIMVDANSCQTFQILDCGPVPSPSVTPSNPPTPSITPSNTPTPSITPTVTPTITITPSVTPTITITPSVTPTITITPSVTQTNTPTATIGTTPSATPTVTPTNTPTATIGLTPSVTPTVTPTNTPTTSGAAYYAYIFAEPQDLTDDTTLYNYAVANGAIDWYSWYSAGLPSNNGGNYSNDLDVYAHQPSFVNGGGDFVTPLNLKGPIAQSSTTYLGCSQNQYTFGTISVSTSQVNTSLQYFYSIWIPLVGVGGTFNQMYFDLGTSLCGSEIYNDLPADSVLNQIDVTVTSGAAIPAGTYRVMWASPNLLRPTTPPLNVTYYFRGESKT